VKTLILGLTPQADHLSRLRRFSRELMPGPYSL